jgi:hypothetical protein
MSVCGMLMQLAGVVKHKVRVRVSCYILLTLLENARIQKEKAKGLYVD